MDSRTRYLDPIGRRMDIFEVERVAVADIREKEVTTCGIGKNVIYVGTVWFAANT